MKQITVEELKSRLQKNPNLHVLDVREIDEFEEYNIGATLLPLTDLQNMDNDVIEDWDEEEPIIVHCRSGNRSLQACLILNSLGYSHTINLEGGIIAWQEKYGEEKIR